MVKKKVTSGNDVVAPPSKVYNHEGLRSLSLEMENFKNIDKMIIDIGGRSILIIGKNGSGKSSIIQAMLSPLDAKIIPSEPIKEGEERATVKHKIGGMMNGQYEEYTLDMFFTPKDKKGRLVVYNSKNEKVNSPAKFIKNLIGNVSFDVTKWLYDTNANKLLMVKSISGCGQKIDLINVEIAKLMADKKYKADRADELESTLKNHEFTPQEVDLYSNPVNLEPLQQQLNGISQSQSEWDGVKTQYDGFMRNVNESNKNIQRHINSVAASNNEIERLRGLIAIEQNKILTFNTDIETENQVIIKNQNNTKLAADWLNGNERPKADLISLRINDAIQHNEKHNRIKMLGTQKMEEIKLKNEVGALKASVEAQEATRNEILSKSQLQIPGFSFTEDGLFIDGLPLESGQINKAREYEIGVQIAKALNPNYRGIFLHDASLFDQETLHRVIQEIEKDGQYFAIAELVSPEGDDLHVEFTEEAL